MNVLKSNTSFRNLLFFSITLLSINQFFQLILIDLSSSTSNQATTLGNAMTLLTVSKIVALPLSGYLVDHFKEKRILMFSSMLFIGFFIFIYLFQSSNQLMVYAIISGALLGLVQPSMYSIVPKIVSRETQTEANSLFQTASQLSQFIIPTIAGFFMGILSRSIYLGLIIFLSVLCLYFSNRLTMTQTGAKPNESDTPKSKLSEVFRNRTILMLFVITALVNFTTSGPLQVTLPVFVSNTPHFTTSTYGYIMSVYGLGTFLGSFSAMFLKKTFESLKALFVLVFSFGLAWSLSLAFPSLWYLFVLFLLSGFFIGLINVLFMSLLQSNTPDHLLGRVTSIQFFFSTILSPLSFYSMGVITSQFSPSFIFSITGVGIVGISIVLVLISSRKKSIV